ncbi:ABC transporter substrate-binding protein [Spirillospora sp. NPDC052242]
MLTIILGACTLTACSGGGPAAKAEAPKLTTSVPAPTRAVDTVSWNLPTGEPATLDPVLAATESGGTVIANMCEGLFTYGPNYEREPALATSVDHPDPLTYVVRLREGAEFWNGDPVTPEDVRYSAERVLDPAFGSSWIAWAQHLDRIEITGAHEITVRMKKPDALVPNYFASPAFFVVQKEFAEKAGKSFGTARGGVMCTGPYEFGEWTQGQRITLTRNDAWWNTSVRPKVKNLEFRFIADPAAQTAALASGDVDGQFLVPAAARTQLEGKGNLLYGESLNTTFLSVLNRRGALADPAVRQALHALLPYEGIVESVYRGTAEPLRALVPPFAWGYGENVYEQAYEKLPVPKQDLERAKKLVAGSPGAKQKIVLAYTTAIEEETRIATAIADTAGQAGLNVELRPLTGEQFGAMFASPEARKGVDLFLSTGFLSFPEPLEYYAYFTTGHFYNFPGYRNERYDAAIAQAQSTEDPAGRARLVARAQAILAGDMVNLPLVSQYLSVYYGPDLAGLAPRANYLYTPWATALGGK